MSKSTAILLLKRKVPDVLTEIPLRAIDIDFKGEEVLTLQEECFIAGWHFFYRGVMYILSHNYFFFFFNNDFTMEFLH